MARLTNLDHLKIGVESSKMYVDSRIGEVAGTVAEVLEELDAVKVDKSSISTITNDNIDEIIKEIDGTNADKFGIEIITNSMIDEIMMR